MKKFLALYMADAAGMTEMMKNSTPEQRRKGTAAWEKWMEDNKASLADRGAPVGTYRLRVYQPGKSDFAGSFEGHIGQIPVYNVAVHVTGRDFWIFDLEGARGRSEVEVEGPA